MKIKNAIESINAGEWMRIIGRASRLVADIAALADGMSSDELDKLLGDLDALKVAITEAVASSGPKAANG